MTTNDPVYVVPGSNRYHTSEECQGLARAHTVIKQSRSKLADEATLCTFCSGEYQPDSASDTFVTDHLLEELDPDDVS